MANDYFFATLKGQTYSDVYQKVLNLDRFVNSYQDRLNNVVSLLKDNSYLVEYFSNYYNPHLTQRDHLSDNQNICHLVELINNYLLMSKEVKDYDNREKTYYIDSRHLDRRPDRPKSNDKAIQEAADNNHTMVVKFDKSNHKVSRNVKIYKADLKQDNYCGKVLRDLQAGIDFATNLLHAHKGNTYKLSKMKHELHDDQVYTKIALKGIFDMKGVNADSSADDYYATLSDPKVVKTMLTMPHNTAFQKSATEYLFLDLQELLKHVYFNQHEKIILYLFSIGYTEDEIANHFRVNQSTISRHLSGLIKRISDRNQRIITKKLIKVYNLKV